MAIRINGQLAATGKPGSYEAIERGWSEGDRITFTLPMGFRVTRYTGQDGYAGRERYAIESDGV